MAAGLGFLTLDDFRGGRNGADALHAIPDGQCAEAINVDWYRGRLGRRRTGAVDMVPPASTAVDTAVYSLIRYLPSASEKQTELFAFPHDGAVLGRFTSGLGWQGSTMGTLDDANGIVHGVSFNNKLFLAGPNSVDRLHLWDPIFNGVREVGKPGPVDPPVVTASGFAGAVSGTRHYRYAWIEKSGTLVIKRSEMSPSASATITSQTGWSITRGAPISLTETHWELYAGDTAAGPWYLIQTIDVASGAVFDSLSDAAFPPLNSELAPIIGSNTQPPNGKYLLVDEARLLIAGSFTDVSLQSRVTWTPILSDASGLTNDERIDAAIRPWIDFDPGDGGEITGLGGPLYDSPYVFKLERIYKMVRTGLAGAAYRPVTVTKKCGALHQRTIVLAEDESGNDAIYFLSRRGPYRIGVSGVQYCGKDIEDLWATVNLNLAVGSAMTPAAHGVYHADLYQVWWYVPTGDSLYPNLKLVFDVRQGQFTAIEGVRRGWCQHDGLSAAAWCSAVFADTVNSPPDPEEDALRLKPYIGQVSEAEDPGTPDLPRVWMADQGALDHGVGYRASLVSAGIVLSGSVAMHGGVLEGHVVIGPGGHAVSFVLASICDYGQEVRFSTVLSLSGTAAVSRLITPVRDIAAASAAVWQLQLLDTLTSALWECDQIVLRVRREEDR